MRADGLACPAATLVHDIGWVVRERCKIRHREIGEARGERKRRNVNARFACGVLCAIAHREE